MEVREAFKEETVEQEKRTIKMEPEGCSKLKLTALNWKEMEKPEGLGESG